MSSRFLVMRCTSRFLTVSDNISRSECVLFSTYFMFGFIWVM